MGLELDILNGIHSVSSPVMDSVMLSVTYAATWSVLWFAIAFGMVLTRKYRRAGIVLIASVILAYVVCDVLVKPAVGRVRPCGFADFELLVPVPDSYSFPSGHTMASFAAATVLLLVFRRWGIPALVFAAAVGFSRMYLFVHWPTDVLAGAVLGTAVAVLVYWVSRRTGFMEKDGDPEVS